MYSWLFWVSKLSWHHNPWISCFPSLLDHFMCPRSVWKWDFVKRRGGNRFLNANDHLQIWRMKSLWSGEKLDLFEYYLGLKICFHPNLSSYNIRFRFRIIDLVNFIFNFGFLSLRDMNLMLDTLKRICYVWRWRCDDEDVRRVVCNNEKTYWFNDVIIQQFRRIYEVISVRIRVITQLM